MKTQNWDTLFIQYRPYLISVAFRMTGSLAEAEDLVQDTFLECTKVNLTEIENPKAWLTKVCSNKALDHLKSAYKKREHYPGVWLPDELPESLQEWRHLTDETDSPEKKMILAESLTTSFLLLMERLTPEERIVYLLKEIFDYSCKEIGDFLGKNEEACRKMAQRARAAVISGEKRFSPPPAQAEKIVNQFFELAKKGDIEKLTKLFSADSELWGDGGGKVRVAGMTKGLKNIGKFYEAMASSEMYTASNYKVEYHQVNSRPGLVISKQLSTGFWVFDTILSFEFENEKIARIYAQRSPDKLATLTLRGSI